MATDFQTDHSEDQFWIRQAQQARFSHEEIARIKAYAHQLRDDNLTKVELTDYRILLARSEKNDLRRAEALVTLSKRWGITAKAVVERIGLQKLEYIYVGK